MSEQLRSNRNNLGFLDMNSIISVIRTDSQLATAVATSCVLLLANVAMASPPSDNTLGATFRVVSAGPSSTVEIKLKPSAAFDTVRVEAASGVGTLSPPCSFDAVMEGGSYVCRVNVSHKAGEASLSLNVVGQRTVDAAKPGLIDVVHFTLPNAAFVAPAVKKSNTPTPGLLSTPGPAAPK